MPYKLVGRTTLFRGKRLWEIIGHLKNFGEGRMVVRSTFEKYPEPTFYRIVLARPEMDTGRPHMDEDNMKGEVLVEKVFRGVHYGVINMSKVAYKPDFRLVHRHEEARYIEAFRNHKPADVDIVSPVMDMPPFLKMVAERDGHAARELKLKIGSKIKGCRVAEEGEVPTKKFASGLGTPASPELYEGVI